MVCVSKLKMLGDSGSIVAGTPFMHFEVEVDALLFRPIVGKLLVGRVNRMSSTHVGALVAGLFNATIPANAMPGYSYNSEVDQW
jgi:DNA-directed RNA polymerase I subunit RPA43